MVLLEGDIAGFDFVALDGDNQTGPRRKELATAVGNFIGMVPVYMKAPTYGFSISNYTIDKNGTITGENNKHWWKHLQNRTSLPNKKAISALLRRGFCYPDIPKKDIF